MRALSRCDFCGADAAGTFELLPPELEPTEDEQRRVVLCQECSTRLEDLLKPLLVRAGVESADEMTATDSDRPTDSSQPDHSPADSPTTDSPSADSSELETVDEDAQSDSAESSRPAVIDVNAAKTDPDENEAGTDADSTESEAAAEPDQPNSSEPTAATDHGITLERTADAESSTGTSTADSPVEDDTDSSADEAHDTDSSTDEDRDAESAADDGGSSNAADSGTSPPRGYGKVIRLLRNREFPMARGDVETLAAGAYDLEPHTVEEIIEYAFEDGEFQEDGDQLVRP
ncbi:hypothetical protein HALLA_19720 [Halostagnicola larsenii XH-48]|uniref:Uncharacterized protein n=1 Tax=Halostagnicola larsenii XH-48 TaxID=797299 RepID=W0JR43_9EURY|nr:hypothetical protein [Halostagnicola larsenii]AHG01201.1 hypothetical protein HALLA_19720 [Halostagnicola larsenii XH-48]